MIPSWTGQRRMSLVFGIITALVAIVFVTEFLVLMKTQSRAKRASACQSASAKPALNSTYLFNNISFIVGQAKYQPANVKRYPPLPRVFQDGEKEIPIEIHKQCSVRIGTSYVGGDYTVVSVDSIEACCHACLADPRCVAWTLEKTHSCWMKDHFPGPYLIAPEEKRASYISGFVTRRENQSAGCMRLESKLEERVDLDPALVSAACQHSYRSYIPQKVLIYGLTHGLSLEKAQAFSLQLERFGRIFSDYRVLVYDNDHPCSPLPTIARNNSRIRVMTEYLQMPPAQIVFETVSCGRVRWLAHLRNRLLSRVREWLAPDSLDQQMDPYQPDLLIQMDFDQLMSEGINPITIGPAICNALLTFRGWDVLCAYGHYQGKFYDTFAVRTCEVEYYEQFHNYSIVGASALALKDAISPRWKSKMRPLPRMLRVQSCFSALSLMKPETILQTQDCVYQEETCMCEHVPFTACLIWRGHGNIFVDTQLVVEYRDNADRKGLTRAELHQDCKDGFHLYYPPTRHSEG